MQQFNKNLIIRQPMKKNLSIAVLLATTILLFCQCSETEFETDYATKEQEVNFPDAARQFGLTVAKELNGAIRNLHKKGADYSNANETVNFKEKFYNDFFKASPSAIKTRSTVSEVQISPEEFARRVNNLTKAQLDFIDRIIKECSVSTSYPDYYTRLIKINNDIYNSVPKIQQDRLFNVTSVLYYAMKEMQNLEQKGFTIPNPRSNIQQVLVKTRSESGGGNFGDTCRKFLATTWAIAIGEPTPAGEVVASLVTVFVAGVWLYEVVVCSKTNLNYDFCQEKWENCWAPPSTINNCEQCYRFCVQQGFWPGASMNCF